MALKKIDTRVLLSPPHMGGEELKFIEKAFHENWIVPLGPNVNQFEQQMVDYLEADGIYAVAMNSGTSAIHIALKLLDVKPGEEILCASQTFIATANPILYEKAVPVFVDSEPDTWNICPYSLQKAIEERKRATGKVPRILICVDLFGMSAKYDEIERICARYGIEIIEDAAEALGSAYRGKKCGTFGRFGILSFNGNKIITTSGGGMLITHSKAEAEHALFLITQARSKAPYYLHHEIGYNYRLSNVCAGIGIGQLAVLNDRVKARRRNFEFYQKSLATLPMKFISGKDGFFSNHWLTTILLDEKCAVKPSDLIEHLNTYNVEARHTWKPLHTQPVFKSVSFYKTQEKAVAETVFDRGVCLPSGSAMTEQTLEQICQIIRAAF